MTANWGVEFLFWDQKSILKLIVVMVTQFSEYTKTHQVVVFKWVDYIVCELHLNKVVIFFKYFF